MIVLCNSFYSYDTINLVKGDIIMFEVISMEFYKNIKKLIDESRKNVIYLL